MTGPGVCIFGATSAIAQATAKLYAAEGARLFLVARDPDKLAAVAQDLDVRGAAAVGTMAADLADLSGNGGVVERALAFLQHIDIALVAHGVLGDQRAVERDFDAIQKLLRVNFASAISLLVPVANAMEERGSGTIAVISSVAGDRGRQSNYIYGTAKAALNVYLQGLRHRLAPTGVHVVTIKPGFVDTPMTAHLPKGPLFVGPDVVARGIRAAITKRKNEVYLPFFWRGIMAIIKAIPEPLFKRSKL